MTKHQKYAERVHAAAHVHALALPGAVQGPGEWGVLAPPMQPTHMGAHLCAWAIWRRVHDDVVDLDVSMDEPVLMHDADAGAQVQRYCPRHRQHHILSARAQHGATTLQVPAYSRRVTA